MFGFCWFFSCLSLTLTVTAVNFVKGVWSTIHYTKQSKRHVLFKETYISSRDNTKKIDKKGLERGEMS